jgi:hypothetical protein
LVTRMRRQRESRGERRCGGGGRRTVLEVAHRVTEFIIRRCQRGERRWRKRRRRMVWEMIFHLRHLFLFLLLSRVTRRVVWSKSRRVVQEKERAIQRLDGEAEFSE